MMPNQRKVKRKRKKISKLTKKFQNLKNKLKKPNQIKLNQKRRKKQKLKVMLQMKIYYNGIIMIMVIIDTEHLMTMLKIPMMFNHHKHPQQFNLLL